MERTGEKGKLSMSLQVHADPQGYVSRLGYYADLFFTQDDAAGNAGPEPMRRHIGYISTWRLSREPNQHTHELHQPWVTEWLRGELGGPDNDSRPFKETMRLLYNENGGVRPVHGELFQTTLGGTGDELMFIEMMWIKYKDETSSLGYSRQRLGPHALELFYSLISNGTLPAWYNINLPITFIMRPGIPSDDGLSEMWFREHPRGFDEAEPQYRNRIARTVAGAFEIGERYGYSRISESPRILALRIYFPQRNRSSVIGSVLEDETEPAAEPGQPKPRLVLSTIRP